MVININKRREKMQQRFCSVCGFPVWVQYRFSRYDSEAIFWSSQDLKGEHLTKCPCCWEKIDIDTLS